MKHACLLVVLTLLFMPYRSSGFVESRHQWWEIRLKKIQEEKARLSSLEDAYPPILRLLDRETARAREIITVLEDDMRDDGSLTHEERAFTREEVAAEAGRVVPPLFALSVLELLVREPGSAANMTVAKEAVARRLERAIGAALGREDPGLAGRIMAVELSPVDWNGISTEIAMGRLMAGWQPGEEAACREVSRRLCDELTLKNFVTNGKELRRRALLVATEHLHGRAGLSSFGGIDAALDSSWSWRTAQSSIDRGLAAHVRWAALMGEGGIPAPDCALRVYKSPIDMDALLFSARHGEFDVEDAAVPPSPGGEQSNTTPEVPRNLPALAEIDRIRTAVVRSLTGREETTLIDATSSRFDSVIQRHTAAALDLLVLEEGKVLRQSGEVFGTDSHAHSGIRAARALFDKRLALLRAYRDRSRAFIRLVWESKRIESGETLSQYRHRTARCREYVAFTLDLVKGCAGLSTFGDPSLHGRYRSAMGSLGSLFQFTGSSHNLSQRFLPHLSRPDIAKIRGIKAESIAVINSMRSEMRDCYTRYGRGLSRTEGNRMEARKKLEEKIAQVEIDALAAHASECAAILGELDHAGDALARYAIQFQTCFRAARDGDISPELAHAARRGSLVPLVRGFDAQRISREYAARRYLVNETRASLARLAALTRYYEKNGTVLRDLPDVGDLGEIERLAGKVVSVKIDAWEMNEANIAEVDRKAAAKLSAVIRRRSYSPQSGAGSSSPARQDRATKVRLLEPELNLAFPAGWEEREVGEIDSLRGVKRIFSNPDGGSLVRLVSIPLQKGGHERAAEEWIRKTGATLVEKKRGRAGDIDYLRILARDRDRNISETCCVERDGYALLINGMARRDQYMKFSIHFARIIESLGMDQM